MKSKTGSREELSPLQHHVWNDDEGLPAAEVQEDARQAEETQERGVSSM